MAPENFYEQSKKLNKKILSDALCAANIAHVTIVYSGYGDSGNGFDIDFYETFDGEQKIAKTKPVSLYVVNRFPQESLVQITYPSLLEALVSFVESVTDTQEAGWENDTGGGGTVTITAPADTKELSNELLYSFEWDHYVNIVEEQHTSFEV